jgi:6-phosphogluconolactonase
MKLRVIHTNSFVEDAVNVIVDAARDAIEVNGLFRLSLCGGSTPKPVYELLGRSPDKPNWAKVQITFGDERCVPPDDPQSNYRMAREAFLDRIAIPEGNVFRIRGEIEPAQAAADYERALLQVASRFGELRYVHDLLLLGMGDDGHTASLFPGTAALDETEHSVVANFVPKFDTHRITFTYPLINAARHVCFLVNDAKKKGVVDQILSGSSDLPAARVNPDGGEVTWLLGF